MKTFFKYLISILSVLTACYLIYLNIKLYYTPDIQEYNQQHYNADVIRQLHFIQSELHQKNAGDAMQQLYPEGYFFSHVLYGLAISEMPPLFYKHNSFRIDANDEIAYVLHCLESDKGTQIFPKDMHPAYGIFYAGWKNYLLGKKLAGTFHLHRDSVEIRSYEQHCDEIVQAFEQKDIPYLESYKGYSWPADNVVAVASLALHDKIFPPKYADFIKRWIAKVKKTTDQNGLIPHKVDYMTGHMLEAAKGSSQSLILCFLNDIDTAFARQQFHMYKSLFADSRFGLPGIREHAKGISADGDIDSGPVILDIGGSASLVGLKTMSIYHERKLMVGLRNSIEAFGMSTSDQWKKKYLFGKMAVADCFIAWSSTHAFSEQEPALGNWRWKFQLICACCILLLFVVHRILYGKILK